MIVYGHQSPEIKKLQQRLVALGYSIAADGVFGVETLGAVRHFQAAHGLSPTGTVDQETLNQIMPSVPAAKRTNPLSGWLTGLAVNAALSKVKDTLPMNFLAGAKTYITAAVLALVAGYSLVFGDLPLVGHVDPGSAIMQILTSLGLALGRAGAKNDVKNASL